MSKNNTPNQEPRGIKRVRLDQEEGNGQAQKKSKGNIEELNNRLFEICKNPNPDIEELRSLIAEGADVNAKDKEDDRPLHLALEHTDNIEVIRVLVESGADVNGISYNRVTPLHYAAEFVNNIEVIRILIEKGADVNAKDEEGKRPLHRAIVYNSCQEIIRILVELGADVNAKDEEGKRPLHYAAEFNQPDEARILLKLGADVNARDNLGFTPLCLTIEHADIIEVIRVLVESGADVNAVDNEHKTVMHSLVQCGHDFESLKVMLDALVNCGVDINARDSKGQTALCMIVEDSEYILSEYKLEEYLVELGADVNVRDNRGKIASSYSESPELKKFLDSGYHIESDALFNDANYNLPQEVAGDSRVYTRYINLLKREGINDVFALLRAIEANETISENGKEIIHQKIGSLIEAFWVDFASLLHHAEGIEAIAPLSLMIENPVGKDSPERDALVKYYNQQAAKYGVNFSCDLMSATTEEVTLQDQMLLKQGIFNLNAKILVENAANWYFSNADARKVLGHIVCHDSKILSFEIRQKLQQINAQYKEYEGNAIMQFVTGRHEQEMEMLKVENQMEIKALKAKNQMMQSILKQVCDKMGIEFDFTLEDNSAMDIEEAIEEEVPIEEDPILEVEEKPLFDLPSSWGDQDFDIVASGDIVQTNLDSVD